MRTWAVLDPSVLDLLFSSSAKTSFHRHTARGVCGHGIRLTIVAGQVAIHCPESRAAYAGVAESADRALEIGTARHWQRWLAISSEVVSVEMLAATDPLSVIASARNGVTTFRSNLPMESVADRWRAVRRHRFTGSLRSCHSSARQLKVGGRRLQSSATSR